MKNSREHAQRLQKFYRALKRAHPKVEPVIHDDPVEAVILGVISERMPHSSCVAAMKGLRAAFINWNDLRVSRVEEIVEAFGNDSPAGRETALRLTASLRAVFDCYHTVSLLPLKKAGKRPARETLEKLQGISRFVINYCMLTSLQAHAIPLTERMIECLRRNGIVDPQADQDDIEGFLTRQVAAKDGFEFYALLRRESESPKVTKTRTKARSRRKTA